jgi:hypothetical protein
MVSEGRESLEWEVHLYMHWVYIGKKSFKLFSRTAEPEKFKLTQELVNKMHPKNLIKSWTPAVIWGPQ